MGRAPCCYKANVKKAPPPPPPLRKTLSSSPTSTNMELAATGSPSLINWG
ncbi:hypothetical protein LINPERHAP2_LOCUS2829 [Linum perenne]